MATCEICGNNYDKPLKIKDADGGEHVFGCFECAIHALAPKCEHCGCRIIGAGAEAGDYFFCCANCAERSGISGLLDRVGELSI
jgi:hypothetical protein